MYSTEGVLSSTLDKQPYEISTTIVETKESQKKAKQKIEALEEKNLMLQVELFKEKKPMQEIFSLHQRDGDVDLLNFTARQFVDKLKTHSVTPFLTLMSCRDQLRGDKYRARVLMSGRKNAFKAFSEAFASFRPAADQ
ncbi:hypothetical protein J6590_073216 [Homalodisca vitripennis]|nr:hypothetical protein J6590_073216 [Homalodisca vitripennis]